MHGYPLALVHRELFVMKLVRPVIGQIVKTDDRTLVELVTATIAKHSKHVGRRRFESMTLPAEPSSIGQKIAMPKIGPKRIMRASVAERVCTRFCNSRRRILANVKSERVTALAKLSLKPP